jgi:hypothetical protein
MVNIGFIVAGAVAVFLGVLLLAASGGLGTFLGVMFLFGGVAVFLMGVLR